MTRQEKRKFICALSRSVRGQMLKAVRDMPETWDGHELRQMFADLYAYEVFTDTMRGRRLREYKNERYTRNLP